MRPDRILALVLLARLRARYADRPEVVSHAFHQLGPEVVEDLADCDLAIFIDGAACASTAKKRATPSGFIMNGPMPSAGSEVAAKSGTSTPVQRSPFQLTTRRAGSQALPSGSAEARL